MDIFNLFNFQGVTQVDDTYTTAAVLPIVDDKGNPGTLKDMPVRNADRTYQECKPPACKLTYADGSTFDVKDINPNFGQPSQYQTPRQFRFSAKVSF
jgi:hypothetical protein